MTIAWVFPGQGSQKLGMANSLQDLPGSILVKQQPLNVTLKLFVLLQLIL